MRLYILSHKRQQSLNNPIIPETPPLKITNFMQYQLMKHG